MLGERQSRKEPQMPKATRPFARFIALGACFLAATGAPAQDAPPPAQARDLPPYVVLPDPRPWEDEASRQTPLRYTIRGAEPSEARPSYAAEEAGLVRLEKGSALVFHS